MRELTAQQVDAGDKLFQNVEPASLDIPALCLVPTVASLSRRLLARILPEVLVEILVFENTEHQRLVILKHRHQLVLDVLGRTQRFAAVLHKRLVALFFDQWEREGRFWETLFGKFGAALLFFQ